MVEKIMEREIYDSITYENGCVRVIYEDNHIIAVEKPQGILSQSDVSEADDLLSEIKKDIAARYNKPGEAFVGLVHRLDRNTGGTMIFAKTSKGASRLSEQLRNKKMHLFCNFFATHLFIAFYSTLHISLICHLNITISGNFTF